ncbi:MAG: hypothetical protein WCI04_03535 [archaeon]
MEQEKKEIENELAELRKELIDVCNEIRDCKNKEIRAQLFEEKKKYLPFYLVEFEWKHDHKLYRGNEFEKFLKNALQHEKSEGGGVWKLAE